MKKYIYAVMFIFSLSLYAAQDEGERKNDAAQESAQVLTSAEQASAKGQLIWKYLDRTDAAAFYKEIETLLEQGADANWYHSSTGMETTLLHLAVNRREWALAELLLRYGANPNGKKDRPIMVNIVTSIMPSSSCFSVEAMNQMRQDSFEKIKFLVNRGADINIKHPRVGRTPLIAAASVSDHRAVSFLLDHGADDTIATKRGRTLHDFAMRDNSILRAHQAWTKRVQCKIEEILPQFPKEVTECITRKLGITDLDFSLKNAIEGGTADDVEAELKGGADPTVLFDVRDTHISPESLIYCAVPQRDGAEKIKVLLKYGADAHQKIGRVGGIPTKSHNPAEPIGNCLNVYLDGNDGIWEQHVDLWEQEHIGSSLKCLVRSGIEINEPSCTGLSPVYGIVRIAFTRQSNHQLFTNACNFLEFFLDHGADTTLLAEQDLKNISESPEITQIIKQAKFKRLSAIDQSLLQMPAAVVGLIGQYSDCCPLEQPKKEKPDAGDEKE